MAETYRGGEAGTAESPPARPLNEPTYVRIKRAIIADILEQRFKPGTQITIDMLTSRYRVSHMPIREAMRQLEGEGVLVSEVHKGFRVEEITDRHIDRIYDIRMAIEAILARRAVEAMTAAEAEMLEAMHRRFLADMALEDRLRASETNIAFHKRFYAIADNPPAEQILDGRTLIVRTFSLSFGGYRPSDRPAVIAEHEEIMAAVRRRDGEAASRAVLDHVAAARDRLKDRIRALNGPAP